jgi:hypothetical protein
MDWYLTAKNEALTWRTDAKLIEIRGDNKGDKTYYTVDGSTDEWIYTFVSVTVLKTYKVVVKNAEITLKQEYDEPLAKMLYDDSPDDASWVIDSTGAVNTVNTNSGGNDFLATISNVKANYLLKLEGMDVANPVFWTISYFPQNYGQSLTVYINGESGKIV